MKLMLVALLLFGMSAKAADGSDSNSQFLIDEGLVSDIFRKSVASASQPTNENQLSIAVSFVMLKPTNWLLKNSYFETQYADNINFMPSVQVSAAYPLSQFGNALLHAEMSGGYGFQNGIYTLRSTGGGLRSDNVQLHVVPLSVALKLEYVFEKLPVRPFLNLGGGVQWNYQTGSLDGFSQAYWIPFYAVKPGIVLFAPKETREKWFGGIKMGAILIGSFASSHSMRAYGMELGLNMHL